MSALMYRLAAQMWARREELVKAFFLTILSGWLLQALVEDCGIAPTLSYGIRWVMVTITGFYVYRHGVDHDGRLFKQITRYSLRRVRKGMLSWLVYTVLVAGGMYFLLAWAVCSTAFGLYELRMPKQSVYGVGPRS